jgi:beta-glucanase (GH16 family)
MLYMPAKINIAILLLAATCFKQNTVSISSSARLNIRDTEYRLVWSDEFNTDGPPDPDNWEFEKGFIRNHELQWYQEDNTICRNGLLEIEARHETKPNPNYVAGSNDWRVNRRDITYTSSCINTKGKRSWQYGRFIMRAKIPIDKGMWPAWWTLGIEKTWPACGEIDIMEYYREKLLGNIACLDADEKPRWISNHFSTVSLGGKTWADSFHIWRMDWTENYIALYVDDKLLTKADVESMQNKNQTGFNPFRQPHYMLLNLAIGGDNGGDPSGTNFPQKYEVDYVRVYQTFKQ